MVMSALVVKTAPTHPREKLTIDLRLGAQLIHQRSHRDARGVGTSRDGASSILCDTRFVHNWIFLCCFGELGHPALLLVSQKNH